MKPMSAQQQVYVVGIDDTSGTINRREMLEFINEIDNLPHNITDFKSLNHNGIEDKPKMTKQSPPKCWYHNQRKKF